MSEHEKRVILALAANKKMKAARKERPILDSGSTVTMFQRPSECVNGTYKKGSADQVQLAAGDENAECLGEGTFKIEELRLEKSVHVIGLNGTLVSVGQICDEGHTVIFTKQKAIVLVTESFSILKEDVKAVFNRNRSNGLYESNQTIHHSLRTRVETRLDVWHNRLAHTSVKMLKNLHKHVHEFPNLHGNMQKCHPCALGKATKKSFDSHFEDVHHAGEIVHSDIAGKLPTSIEGNEYFCVFVDPFSRIVHVKGLPSKDKTQEAFELYKTDSLMQKYFKNGVERFHSDGGGEFFEIDISNKTAKTPHTPQHNPFSERTNRTILDPVRVLLEQAGLSAKYWEYAMYHVVHVQNRIPHSALGCSPFEKLTGKKPKLNHVRVFGCT